MSKRWDPRGEDEKIQKQLRVEVSKAMAQVVRHYHHGQLWFKQQPNVENIKDYDR